MKPPNWSMPDLPRLAQVTGGNRRADSLAELRPRWQAHVELAQARIPGLQVASGGENLYLGELSPGCQACKAGRWDCVFITMQCNLDCDFCYSPQAISADYSGSALGSSFAALQPYYDRLALDGIGLTGGEPFLQPDALLAWLEQLKGRYPERYYWVYTNGWLAEPEIVQRLGELGLDEMRFNLAASGYRQPHVLKNLAAAARYIPNLTVEIPAIPTHARELLASLETWSSLGVRYLNLHELLYEPGTRAAGRPGERLPVTLPDGHRTAIDPHSRALTLQVMQQVQALGLPLAVNDCSLQSKLRQLRGRRRSLAIFTRQNPERLWQDEYFESYCAYRSPHDWHWFAAQDPSAARERYPGVALYRLLRLAPLTPAQTPQWIEIDLLTS